jgi:hypothetical protein
MTDGELIKEVGGATVLANELKIPVPTAHSWLQKDKIPSWRMEHVLTVARAKGIDVSEFEKSETKDMAA